ncbi:MAG: hypothetical protein WBP16_17405 [Ferruginibacter sp.]
MNSFSKLVLSDEEQQLVNNREWILTKRVILDKVQQLLGNVSVIQKEIIQQEQANLPAAVLQSDAKISKGENYLQLPFLILDYPRCFAVENIFAVRTMFWWGNFFSITLHLSGIYKQNGEEKIIAALDEIRQKDFYLCISKTEWHHHFDDDNYVSLKQKSNEEAEEIIRQQQFIKLAVKFPLTAWNDISLLLEKSFTDIIKLVRD